MTAGPLIMSLGLLWLSRMPDPSSPWRPVFQDPGSFVPTQGYVVDVLPGMILFGIGLMIMVAPLTATLMASLQPDHLGVGSAFNNAVSRVGPQLTGALLFVAMTSAFQGSITEHFAYIDFRYPETRQALSPLNPPGSGVPADVADAARDASGDAFAAAMRLSALLCLAGAAVNAKGIVDPAREPGAVPVAGPIPPVVEDAGTLPPGERP